MKGFLLGMLAWQIICFILLLFNNDAFIIAMSGLPGLIFLGGFWVFDKIRAFIKTKRFKGWLIDKDGRSCYCESKYYDFFISLGDYTIPDLEKRMDAAKKTDGKNNIIMGVVNTRYTPLRVLKDIGAYPLCR